MLDMTIVSLDINDPQEVAMVLWHHGTKRWDPARLGPCALPGFPAPRALIALPSSHRFGKYSHDELSILAPLHQCCR